MRKSDKIRLAGQQFINTKDVYVYLNVSGILSEKRYYKKSDRPDKFVGYWTAVVTMDKGVIQSKSLY